MEALLRMCITGAGGRIVSTNDLSVVQVDDAWFHSRYHVDAQGFGWVFLPWGLKTNRDTQREAVLRSM